MNQDIEETKNGIHTETSLENWLYIIRLKTKKKPTQILLLNLFFTGYWLAINNFFMCILELNK